MFEKLKKIFKKEKKQMADLDKMLESLSDEEKKELKAKLQDLYKAEDEREIDKVEEEKADDTDVAEEKREEVKEESEEIGKDVDELEDKIEDEKAEETAKEDKSDDRLGRLEEQVGKIFELLTKKQGVEEKAEEVYGLGNGVFQGEDKAPETKKISASEIAQLLNKIKR